jgi:hypothetical protein
MKLMNDNRTGESLQILDEVVAEARAYKDAGGGRRVDAWR